MNIKYLAKEDTRGYLVDSNWKPMKKTLKQWQRFADGKAKKANARDFKGKRSFWEGFVFVGDSYVRISIAGKC